VDAAVALVRVLSGEPEDERSDAADGRWSTPAIRGGMKKPLVGIRFAPMVTVLSMPTSDGCAAATGTVTTPSRSAVSPIPIINFRICVSLCR
jgi:hypothetical protein